MTVRKTATYASGLTRQIPSWQRAWLAAVVIGPVLSCSFRAPAPRSPLRRTTRVGEWSAPVAWPLVAVHMSLEPTGQVFTLDGFDDGANSGTAVESSDRRVPARPVRTKSLLRRPHPARRRPHAARRRTHQRKRRPRRHHDLQPGQQHVLPRARHVRRALVSDGDAAARRPSPHVRG